MLPQFPPCWSDSVDAWGWGRWHSHLSTSKAHIGIPGTGSFPQSQVQPFRFNFFVLGTRRSHQIGSALCTCGFFPLSERE